jgi:hypothetical protein
VFGWIAGLEDALARGKPRDLHLRGQNTRFIVVQKFEQRNVPQFFGITGHGSPHSWPEWGQNVLF